MGTYPQSVQSTYFTWFITASFTFDLELGGKKGQVIFTEEHLFLLMKRRMLPISITPSYQLFFCFPMYKAVLLRHTFGKGPFF